MIEYIWIDDKSPILSQLKGKFESAVILLHPFVQMPIGWEKEKRKTQYEHVYPSDEEILRLGKPVHWEKVIFNCGFQNNEELALALKTSIVSLNSKYARSDLSDKLILPSDMFYPTDDSTSVFLIKDLLSILGSKGATKVFYSAPILEKNGTMEISRTSPIDICEISCNELIVSDENMDFAFMSDYDSFITLLFSRDQSIEEIVKTKNFEFINCDKETMINWYL